jgi:hypothetical protein
MNYGELKEEFSALRNRLKRFEDRVGYDGENIEAPDDANERQLHDMARRVADRLYDIRWDLTYLAKDVMMEGELFKLPGGRYGLGDVEFTSGSSLEVYVQEDETWVISSVEHNGHDYYIKSLGVKTPINGVRVRIRG